jgi:hypothetical protein
MAVCEESMAVCEESMAVCGGSFFGAFVGFVFVEGDGGFKSGLDLGVGGGDGFEDAVGGLGDGFGIFANFCGGIEKQCADFDHLLANGLEAFCCFEAGVDEGDFEGIVVGAAVLFG